MDLFNVLRGVSGIAYSLLTELEQSKKNASGLMRELTTKPVDLFFRQASW
jgi:hypothetical protein